MHHFVGADNSCISWGHASYGELGYGPMGQKYVIFSFVMGMLFPYTCFLIILTLYFEYKFGRLSVIQVVSYPQKGRQS